MCQSSHYTYVYMCLHFSTYFNFTYSMLILFIHTFVVIKNLCLLHRIEIAINTHARP